jgi:uncharacterized protein YkwD
VNRLSLAVVGAVAGLTLAACPPGGPQKVGQQPSWREGDGSGSAPAPQVAVVAPVVFAPTTDAAQRYNEPVVAPPHSPLGDAVVKMVTDAAAHNHLPPPVADARLFRACEELASVVPDDGLLGYSLIEFALLRNGIVEPSPRLLVVWADVSETQQILEQLQTRVGELLADGATARVGIGAVKRKSDGVGAIVFALQGSGVSTSPMPRTLPANGSFVVDAVVDAKYKEPEVFVTHDDGSTQRLELKLGHAGGFQATVNCGQRIGRQQVEITASDTSGSTVLANFPVWCAMQPPTKLTVDRTVEEAPVKTTEDAEKHLLAMVNRDRQAAGLSALVWDDKVAAVARAHSDEMNRTKVVAHISPTTGSAADRVRAAKIKTAVVLENVARAYGVGEAHQGLMNSPGHRANILSSSATNIGIGAVFGDTVSGRREIFITQVFTRVPPKIDAQKAADTVTAKITAAKSVTTNKKLAAIAQQMAVQLAAGKTRDEAYDAVKKQVEAFGNVYARVSSVVTAAADLEQLDGGSLLGSGKTDEVGVGVAQGPHPEIGDSAMWIVVLLAQKR